MVRSNSEHTPSLQGMCQTNHQILGNTIMANKEFLIIAIRKTLTLNHNSLAYTARSHILCQIHFYTLPPELFFKMWHSLQYSRSWIGVLIIQPGIGELHVSLFLTLQQDNRKSPFGPNKLSIKRSAWTCVSKHCFNICFVQLMMNREFIFLNQL